MTPFALTAFQGRAGERSAAAQPATLALGQALARRLGTRCATIGTPQAPIAGGWQAQLAAARSDLAAMAARQDATLANRDTPLLALTRCAVGLATLPVVARHRPDCSILWLDAHGDLNTPASSDTGYLGGMVITGAAGLWQSGLGDELDLGRVVLAGAREIDPPEQALIDAGSVRHVPIGPDFADRVRAAVAGSPVYIHLDCDVLEPGEVTTEYSCPGGLTLETLRGVFAALADCEIVGIEIAELQSDPRDAPGHAEALAAALDPLLAEHGV